MQFLNPQQVSYSSYRLWSWSFLLEFLMCIIWCCQFHDPRELCWVEGWRTGFRCSYLVKFLGCDCVCFSASSSSEGWLSVAATESLLSSFSSACSLFLLLLSTSVSSMLSSFSGLHEYGEEQLYLVSQHIRCGGRLHLNLQACSSFWSEYFNVARR